MNCFNSTAAVVAVLAATFIGFLLPYTVSGYCFTLLVIQRPGQSVRWWRQRRAAGGGGGAPVLFAQQQQQQQQVEPKVLLAAMSSLTSVQSPPGLLLAVLLSRTA